MSSAFKRPFLFIFFIGCNFTIQAIATDKYELADSLYQMSIYSINDKSFKENLKAFEDILKIDPRYARAHYGMAKLYLSLDGTGYRQQAQFAIEKAVSIEPENAEYQLLRGDLLENQGLLSKAKEQYKNVLKMHPQNVEATYKVGYLASKEFLKYVDMEMLDKNFDSVSGVTYRMFYWEQFGKEYQNESVLYLNKVIDLDPEFRDAYYTLGMIYFENNEIDLFLKLFKQLLERIPDDKDALLFYGLGCQKIKNFELANLFYKKAFDQMDREERQMMESIDLIATTEEKRQLITHKIQESNEEFMMRTDSQILEKFWKKRDPLLLTEFNEQRLEHYGRVAYANLRFSQPSKRIAGWQTDQGKAYIRFGRYRYRKVARSEIAITAEVNRPPPRPSLVTAPGETWFYEGFSINFKQGVDSDSWRFATPSSFRLPPRYVDLYQKVSLPHQIATFYEGDSTSVELSYAVPKAEFGITSGKVNLEDGIFIFDENWEELYKERVDTIIELSSSMPEFYQKADSLRDSYLVFQKNFKTPPDSYLIAVEVRNRKTNIVGTFRKQGNFLHTRAGLKMSDLLLASRIEARNPMPTGRRDFEIVPNPIRTYHPSEPVFIYLEMYHLTQNAYGQTRYDISYRLEPAEKKEIDPAQFVATDISGEPVWVVVEQALGEESGARADYQVRYVFPENRRSGKAGELFERVGGRGVATEVTVEYAGNQQRDFTYLQIDVQQVPPGVYKLRVEVRDRNSRQRVEKAVLFRMIR